MRAIYLFAGLGDNPEGADGGSRTPHRTPNGRPLYSWACFPLFGLTLSRPEIRGTLSTVQTHAIKDNANEFCMDTSIKKFSETLILADKPKSNPNRRQQETTVVANFPKLAIYGLRVSSRLARCQFFLRFIAFKKTISNTANGEINGISQ